MVNLKSYNALPKTYKIILKYAAQAASLKGMAFWEGESARSGEYCIMQAKKSKFYARLLKSQMMYLKEYKDWRELSKPFGHGQTPPYVDKVLAALDKMGVE
ncbi:MAG: hypothetical protein B1H13_10215 [Desulfobacteraceae bacterium 4484_190.3]|nr:MAG: hypothetical protein B1H13_10215 [Desulfobacteraceae bacterium 4484_190.3]